MSSILKNDYVGRVDITDPNYPWGKGQNRLGSVPNTGTPFDEKWFNDFEGNKQAYLRLAGIVPSGNPDNAVESDQLEAIKRISNAFLVGNPAGSFRYGFDFTSANDVGIANDGTFWKYSGTDPYPVTVAEDTDPLTGDFTQAFARDGQPNPVGNFSDVGGVTFNFPNDVARDASGEYWSWTGSLPYTAAQNTIPSEPNYSKRLANVAENISNDDGSTAQDTYDALKATLVAQGLSGNFGFFADGFTLNDLGDVGIDASYQFWKYTGAETLPYAVPQGTDPSAGDWVVVKFNFGIRFAGSVKDLSSQQFFYFLTNGDPVEVLSFWGVSEKLSGGGEYVWDANKSKTEHNGGTIIDPLKVSELGTLGVFNSYFTPSVSGVGCFVLLDNDNYKSSDPSLFGALDDPLYDDLEPITASINSGSSSKIPSGIVTVGGIDLLAYPRGKSIKGESIEHSTITMVATTGTLISSLRPDDGSYTYGNGLSDIRLQGSGGGNAIELDRAVYGTYENVFIRDFENGLIMDKGFGNKLLNFQTWNCSGIGVNFTGDNNNALTMQSCHVNSSGIGIRFIGYQLSIEGSIIELCDVGVQPEGVSYKCSIHGSYLENNGVCVRLRGNHDVDIQSSLFKLQTGQTGIKVVNSNTQSRLEVNISGCNVLDNISNSVAGFIDLTEADGNDIIKLRIENNYLRSYNSGSNIFPFVSGGVEVIPNPKFIEHCDIPLYTDNAPTMSVGSITIIEPLKYYALEDGKMRITGVFTVDTASDISGYSQVRIQSPTILSSEFNELHEVGIQSTSLSESQAVVNVRTDALITIGRLIADGIVGDTIILDVTYNRLRKP